MSGDQTTPGHLLIVEGDPQLRELLARRFRAETPYEVTLAADGREALERFRADPAEVVVTDLALPGMSGLELIFEIKRLQAGTLFVALVDPAAAAATIPAIRAGAVDFFQKPFQVGGLLAGVDRAFQQIAARHARRALQSYSLREERRLRIPNDLGLIPHVIAELTRNLDHEAGLTPDEVEGVRAALHEMTVNAIEHGNLGITFEEKSRLMETPRAWWEEIQRRGRDSRLADRRATLTFENTPEAVVCHVADEGEGFNHADVPDPTEFPTRLHGRGILIARIHMDEVTYNAKGNAVRLVKRKRGPSERGAALPKVDES